MFKELNILKIFFETPSKEFNVREIARIAKIAPATASKELKFLAKEKILKERKDRNFNFYKANIDNENYRDLKVYYNIRKIKESGLVDEFNKFFLKPTIVLFGSSSEGFDIENSDFDFLIISEKIKLLELKNFEKKINRKIQLFVVKNIKDLKNEHLINNILNGFVLQGKIKWI